MTSCTRAYKFRLYPSNEQGLYYEFVSQKVTPKNIVGIDLGVKDLVVTSDNEKFNNPKELAKTKKDKRFKCKKMDM